MSQTVQRKENKLAKEKLLYLLQHKNNPVDWFSWRVMKYFQELKLKISLYF
ncbi:DUF255 domain-containing protein [Abyssisolibacter fermentans]|uniref:DUF255 domain-containing protein n=1 Tax=Abyssisolibacter fermentans TaxID=1766203 RepID=UPI001FA80BFA|nr:DUF255 domain-containing protein [Abyssisolibacter fermentans]